MTPRFRNLTKAQENALALLASGWDGGAMSHPRTLKALEDKGLIVGRDVLDTDAWPPITIRQYEVPLPVHIEWCQWCSEHYGEEDS